ncbi:hypothetical protein [Micromonospora sp. LOL_023]|uniref:hypothetical protein n=1 Tax=Micromonospora sp. LOL_023 TaxID=3345418 RepID=UPI003A83D258
MQRLLRDIVPTSTDQVVTGIQLVTAELRGEVELVDETSAAWCLLAEDMDKIAAVLDGQRSELAPAQAGIEAAAPAIAEQLGQIGLDVESAPPKIVDRFPVPFDSFEWSAFAPDAEDEERFGIARGVWFRQDRLRPLYSEALYAHEVVHTVTGTVDPHIYAMGLEEGIAEVIGTCYAGSAVIGADAVLNILLHGRHGADRPRVWAAYREHTRQAFLLYREFGLLGLAELVRRGRAAIHAAEATIQAGGYRELDLPRDGFDDDTTRVLEIFTCGFMPAHVFTPFECHLLRHVRQGSTFDEVCRTAQVPPPAGNPVLRRLGAESALFVADDDRIAYSNVERYLRIGQQTGRPVLRYLPPADLPSTWALG